MKKKYTRQDWTEQFTRELKGHSPSEFNYSPIPDIDSSIYLSPVTKPSFDQTMHNSPVLHSIFCNHPDLLPAEWNDSYHLENYYHTDVDHSIPIAPHKIKPQPLEKINHTDFKGQDNDIYVMSVAQIDLSQLAELLKLDSSIEIWLKLDRDFYLNIAIIRGIQKALSQLKKTDQYFLKVLFKMPTRSDLHHSIIEWSQQCTSSLLCGLHQYIWQFNPGVSLSQSEIALLLNIPEILVQESNLLGYGDAIRGADFLEEISDQIADRIL